MKSLFARIPRLTLAALLLIPILLLIDAFCYQITLPVAIDIQHGASTLTVGSTRVPLGKLNTPQSLQFVAHNPLIHEYQIDGSDSTNNQNLDTTYLSQIASSPYYRWQSWMRDLDGTSRWRDLQIQANGHLVQSSAWPGNGARFSLPDAPDMHISLRFQRPETPMSLNLALQGGRTLQITLDRNDRQIVVSDLATSQTLVSAFFPVDTAPFAAMVIDTLARILLWALVLLLVVQVCEMWISFIARFSRKLLVEWGSRQGADKQTLLLWAGFVHRAKFSCRSGERRVDFTQNVSNETNTSSIVGAALAPSLDRARLAPLSSVRPVHPRLKRLFQSLHPIAFIALACSLAYVIWIAVKEYQGQPHIYDASAYFFAAKMYASGQLSVPAPPASQLFPGPFMVLFNGRWFAQYDPGTALTLVPGIWFHVPWLVEPLLGTLALLGIGLIAARLYNRRVATLAVLLGCLSPFYSYLAASYLSHTIALFYLVWGLWALLRFAQGASGWNMLICGVCFGMAAFTRDLVALLYVAVLIPGVVIITWKRGKYRQQRLRRLAWWLALLLIGMIFFCLYLGYNQLLTGDPLATPRSLFFPGDTWGFGKGIGFYGQHTLAAGFVNIDELLTSLQIDLFGWPFYLTLAFIAIPFLTGRARKADWVLLIALVLTAGSYIGYFYHGIYLGPRYLFEDLPFLLILSARGILLLGAWGLPSPTPPTARASNAAPFTDQSYSREWSTGLRARRGLTLALVGALILCNLVYYLPRQATRYQNFSGLPSTYNLHISQLYHAPVHHAIVVTDDLLIYQVVLFPLNDPALKGDVIYAWGYTSTQFAQLHKAFPGRAFYILSINLDGSVNYIPYSP